MKDSRSRRRKVNSAVVACAAIVPTIGLGLFACTQVAARAAPSSSHPNILFIILDDIGIDQLRAFNPDAIDQVQTPNLQAIADAGVKFTNLHRREAASNPRRRRRRWGRA
jgi:hypothetical protein